MPEINLQSLDYGIIYVCGNSKQTHNLRWFATMIDPMIRPLTLEWVETWQLDHTLIVARRFNIGNMGKHATVQLHLNEDGRSDSYSLLAAVHAFADCLQDVMDAGAGDVIIHEADYSDRNELPQGKWGTTTSSTPIGEILEKRQWDLEMPQDHTLVKRSRPVKLPQLTSPEPQEQAPEPLTRRLVKSLRRRKRSWGSGECAVEENRSYSEQCVPEQPSDVDSETCSCADADESIAYEPTDLLDLEAEELTEFKRIEAEYERDVKDLRARIVAFIAKYHQDPEQLIATMLEGKVLLGSTPGRVLVNGDMKIVLPDYDELEIEMPAMCRTLYILFMKHRKQGGDGIVLMDMDQYRDKLIDIYGLVKPGASDDRVERTVGNLCAPASESLHQTISRINHCVRNVITDETLARNYCILGERGQRYGLQLEPQYLELPRAVTGE